MATANNNQAVYMPFPAAPVDPNPMPMFGGNPLTSPTVNPGDYGYVRQMGPQATFSQSLIPNPVGQALDFSGADLSLAGTNRTWLQSIGDSFSDSGFLGSKNANGNQIQGWGGLALGGLQGLGSLYMGMKQYGLAKDQLGFQKDAFSKNYEAQKMATNTQLEDRQRARVASNSGAYQSVGDYMKQNGVA